MAQQINSVKASLAGCSCTGSLRTVRLAGARPGRKQCVQTVNAVKEIFMPALSSTMTEGKIVSWLKGPGDKVARGESVVVVESDKADMDVESFSEGFLGAIVIPEGGVANVGATIAYVAETEAELDEAKARASSNGAVPAAPAPVAAKAPEPAVVSYQTPITFSNLHHYSSNLGLI